VGGLWHLEGKAMAFLGVMEGSVLICDPQPRVPRRTDVGHQLNRRILTTFSVSYIDCFGE